MKPYFLNPFVLLFSFIVLLSACQKDEEEDPDLATIEYTLSSPGAGQLADIEYSSVFGMVIQLEDEPLPWSTSFTAIFKQGDAISFHAESSEAHVMTAQIIVNDQVVATGTASHLIQLDYIKGLK